MRIAAITLEAAGSRPALEMHAITPGLNGLYGPPRSGKSSLAELLAQTLFGKRVAPLGLELQGIALPGEIIIESGEGRYRVRRYRSPDSRTRLTVAGLNGAPVDPKTIKKLAGGLPPTVLSPLCAVSFRETPNIDHLLSAEFARGWQSIDSNSSGHSRRRTTELVARRDLLAQELETRIAGERRVSKELEARSRDLDRLVRDEQQQAIDIELRLRAVETALAETDARLRYRRLEMNVELRWQQAPEPCEGQAQSDELDQQIARWRSVLAEMAQREAVVRAQLAADEAACPDSAAGASDHRAWLAVARQLAADLAGEVARLARASNSEQCVCRDAHPRLRPIAETMDRQLDRLESLIDGQQRAVTAAKLQVEVHNLSRSQDELKRHLQQLLDRRQERTAGRHRQETSGDESSFSAADAEQLETRRSELEQERFQLLQRLRAYAKSLRELREQRDAVGRERAGLLSVRSIEHVQRELSVVQQKLEQAAVFNTESGDPSLSADAASLASDFLAQLTDGGLVRLMLDEAGRGAFVVNRAGESIEIAALPAAERDLVYLSLCLARLSAASRQGIWLPLVLDEPFERLDARGVATLAAVLDDFSRQGHQVLVFTANKEAMKRLASLGAAVHDIRHSPRMTKSITATQTAPPRSAVAQKPKTKKRKTNNSQGSTNPSRPLNGKSSGHSDAA